MIVSIIIVVLSALLSSGAVSDPRPAAPPCEDSWIWVNGRCYYFSETTNTWNNSRDFCTEHGSTLAVLIDQEIKKVIDRYRENVNYWIGLSMDHNGQWIWTNGSRYNGSVDNQDSRHLRCAFLNSHLGALHCSTPRQWICVQDST
ncbi:early activation antigen CD69-like [Anomaloglossus baeobatrachus]|uniref:early activation antigen CD69-like n=1 Tax=Anomaloglossus baeobatrachus TaxID=238106 RepID=UPI003F4FF032